MSNEILTRWSSIAEIASGIAVVVSLVFVIQGMQKNTDAVNAATLQATTDASNDFLLTVLENPELRNILNKGHSSYNQLEPEELSTYTSLVRNRWVRFQSNFSQWKRGVLDDGDWAFYERLICNVPSNHGTVLSWSLHKNLLAADFVEYVERCEVF